MSAFLRAMVPVIALGTGTWLGMGRPDARTALAEGTKVFASTAHAVHEAAPDLLPAPPLDPPTTMDASVVPDPAPLWPRLNPDVDVQRAWLLAEGPAHAAGDRRRLVTFTFDDGPFPETAPTVLRILEKHHVHATFFFIGKYLVGDDKHAVETRMWARRIADAGHLVGNHTFDHKQLTLLTHAAVLAEIDDCAAAIERVTGKRPVLFRPPYGEFDSWLQSALRERRLDLLLWSVDVEDIKKDDPDVIVRELTQQLEYKGGGVVLLHDMHWPSVKALNRLLRSMEGQRWDPTRPDKPGWDIVDLPEYLRATAASPQPYANRTEIERARQTAAERRAGERER